MLLIARLGLVGLIGIGALVIIGQSVSVDQEPAGRCPVTGRFSQVSG